MAALSSLQFIQLPNEKQQNDNEWQLRKEMETSGHGILYGIILAFARWCQLSME
jgi:hypothetical protein